MLRLGYYGDMGPVMEETGLNGYDADDEVFSSSVVHKGDKVMIQSKLSGKLLLRFLLRYRRIPKVTPPAPENNGSPKVTLIFSPFLLNLIESDGPPKLAVQTNVAFPPKVAVQPKLAFPKK